MLILSLLQPERGVGGRNPLAQPRSRWFCFAAKITHSRPDTRGLIPA
jgi:hypothetical protein